MNSISLFNNDGPNGFINALKAFFQELKVPVDYLADEPASANDILGGCFKANNNAHKLIEDVYALGIVNDDIFKGTETFKNLAELHQLKADYDGLLLFGVTLDSRKDGLPITRNHLAEITRAFNRAFPYTPVVIIFKYSNLISFANSERIPYKQEWREGEKAGKVSLLMDISITNTHAGHLLILKNLEISRGGSQKIDSYAKLYAYWQEVFSVSLLSKKFYQELSNWYFWATKHVTFPGEPTAADAHLKNAKIEDLIQEHRATNVIRMLTRLLFVWFIKEKKLIPEELFDLVSLQKDILNEISPVHETGMFKERNKESIYYKAILQNLFFATLNCPIDGDSHDTRKRGFRGEGYGTNRGVDYLMRYKQYFKNPDAFVEKMNAVVPFLNGGLFECLDDKIKNSYVDGFSDGMTANEKLIVPDYLFFGAEEAADISDIIGINDKKYKNAAVKGLINILKSYKFTITENTPIEEEVALDPELLGKVFENLLASYNPETKSTARKQTGSFYTPREIVNYMVDESLIAYLKNKILENNSPIFFDLGSQQAKLFGNEHTEGQLSLMTEEGSSEFNKNETLLDERLHQLVSYDPGNPFGAYPEAQKIILRELSICKILDPACGSGAFPMGILQKMVHILQKLDPENKIWKEVQLEKARRESKAAFEIEDSKAREERLLEINEAFDQSINDPDYARKLFLIENCIFGVDIQPIAVQITKLRFFISLVVEQKVNPEKHNFGIRALPNLETKFVAANTLIGIEKPSAQLKVFDNGEVSALEKELKQVRHKLFNAKTKDTKLKYRQKDEELRNKIAEALEKEGWPTKTASLLASWDPYNQNASSPFFDPEWMFDIQDGFDIITGNPPWGAHLSTENKLYFKEYYTNIDSSTPNSFAYFIGEAVNHSNGVISYVLPDSILIKDFAKTRKLLKDFVYEISWYLNTGIPEENRPFIYVEHDVCVLLINMKSISEICGINKYQYDFKNKKSYNDSYFIEKDDFIKAEHDYSFNLKIRELESYLYSKLEQFHILDEIIQCHEGIHTGNSRELLFHNYKVNAHCKPLFYGGRAGDKIRNYVSETSGWFVDYRNEIIDKEKGFYASLRDERIFKLPKIYITRTGNPMKAFYDENNYASNNFFSLQFKNYKDNNERALKAILPLILSKFSNYYIRVFAAPRLGDTFIETKIFHILKIPYPKEIIGNSLIKVVCDLIIKQIESNNDTVVFQDIMDGIIFNFYFPNHLKERDINIITLVEQDIKDVIQGGEFEELNDTQKEQVIKQLHKKWTDPDNEVVKRMGMFKEKSPEILKVILES